MPFEWQGYKGEVFCRVVGDKLRETKTGVPPVLLVGNPGVGYDYLENLEVATVSDRRVIEVTFAGTRGDVPAAVRSVEACAAQLEAVCRTLELSAVHVLAHGLGAPPALQLLQSAQAPTPRVPLRSLTLVSPYGSLDDLRAAARPAAGAKALLPLPTSDAKAPNSCIADATASTAARPWLDAVAAGGASLGGDALVRLLQPASAARVAALVVWGGDADVVEPTWDVAALQKANVNLRVYERSGHLPFIEQREEFLGEYLDFLDAADGVKTSRELILDPSIDAIKSKSI